MALNLTPLATLIIKQVAPPIIEKIKNKISPDELQRAIVAGVKAAEAEEENLPNEQHLFFKSKPDSLQGVPGFLGKFFQLSGVQGELAKPFNDEGLLDVDYLAENFHKVAEDFPAVNPITDRVKPWLNTFANTYFQETNYLRFKVAQEDYFKQLNKRYDDIKFAGIAVSGQEEERKRLQQIFVMPDVVERESNKQSLPDIFIDDEQLTLQQRLISEQRQLARLGTTSNNPFLAKKLLTETKSKKAVILGAPGSGKSTLVSYFAVMLAQGNAGELGLDKDIDWLPIVIEIRDLERNLHLNFLEYLHQFAESNLTTKTLPQDFFKHWLERGKALILLDGIDEVAETGKRYEVVQRIELFLNQYEGNIAIITSRPSGYKRDFFSTAEFPHYQLQPFDDDKIEEFINHWYDSRYDDPQEANRCKNTLRKALEDNNRIKLLAKNPLLITIIALIHRYQAYLPKERHKLYDKAVETLLISWDTKKAISGHKALKYLDLDDLRRLLESLAHWIHAQGSTGDKEGGTQIDRDELLSWLSQYIKTNKQRKLYEAREEAERFLNFIRERTGLLNEQGTNRYAFVHKTFQEYLCAQDINYEADDEDDFDIVLNCIKEHLHDAHWREVLLLLVAQQKPQKAIKAIKTIYENNSHYEQWLHRDLLFAGSCLADSPKGMAVKDKNNVSQQIINDLIDIETADNTQTGEITRQKLLQILSSFRQTDWQIQVLNLITKYSKKIEVDRFYKYKYELENKNEIITTILILLDCSNSDRANKLLFVLIEICKVSKEATSYLLEISKTDDVGIRCIIAFSLGEIGNKSYQVLSTLLFLLKDNCPKVRENAIKALDKLGEISSEIISNLLYLLEDNNNSVGNAAANALVSIGKNNTKLVSVLFSLVQRTNFSEVRRILWILGKIGNPSPEITHSILSLLSSDDPNVRHDVARALGELGIKSPKTISALLSLLQDNDPRVRYRTAWAFGVMGQKTSKIISALLPMLQDNDPRVRYRTAWAFGEIARISSQALSTTVISTLFLMLQDNDPRVRYATAWAIGEIAKISSQPLSTQLISDLTFLLKDNDPRVRYVSVSVIGELEVISPEIILHLLSLLKDEDYRVRVTIASVIGDLEVISSEIILHLLSLLKDEDYRVRRTTICSLEKTYQKFPILLTFLENWIIKNKNTEYVGNGIDVLCNLVVDDD